VLEAEQLEAVLAPESKLAAQEVEAARVKAEAEAERQAEVEVLKKAAMQMLNDAKGLEKTGDLANALAKRKQAERFFCGARPINVERISILQQQLAGQAEAKAEATADAEATRVAAEEAARSQAEEVAEAAKAEAAAAARLKAEDEAATKLAAEKVEAAWVAAREEAARLKAEEEEEAARLADEAAVAARVKLQEEVDAKLAAEKAEATQVAAEEAARSQAEEAEPELRPEPEPQPADSIDLTVPMAGWPVATVLAWLGTVDGWAGLTAGLGTQNLTAARQRMAEEEYEGEELAVALPKTLRRLLRGTGVEEAAPLILAARDAHLAIFSVPMASWPVATVLAWLATVDGLGMRNLTAARQRTAEEEYEGAELAVALPKTLRRLLRGTGVEEAVPLILAARDAHLQNNPQTDSMKAT
jgi:hypothetical protein